MSIIDKLRGGAARRAAFIAAAVLLSVPCLAAEDEVFKATAGVVIPTWPAATGNTSFDISFVDPQIHTYVLGDRTSKAVDVIDTHSLGLRQLPANPPFQGFTGNNNTSGPDGVIIVHHSEVWVGDGDSTVKVINLSSGATTHVISTGGSFRADEECFDQADNLLMVANNADSPPFATIISAADYTVKHKVTFTNSTNGAEQCQWSPRTGKFYITIPGVNSPDDGTGVVEVIDPTSGTIVNTFKIDSSQCNTPQGLAVGPDHQIMVGCNDPSGNTPTSGIIIDERDGTILATIPNESGPDEVWYNEGDGQYFLARSSASGTTEYLGVVDANDPGNGDLSVALGSKGKGSAHSVAADSETKRVFVPIPNGLSTCSQVGLSDTNGCIAVFTAKHDDKKNFIVRGNGGSHDD